MKAVRAMTSEKATIKNGRKVRGGGLFVENNECGNCAGNPTCNGEEGYDTYAPTTAVEYRKRRENDAKEHL